MIVTIILGGPAGCGKTTIYNLLRKVLLDEGFDVVDIGDGVEIAGELGQPHEAYILTKA